MAKLLLYCTKAKPNLVRNESDKYWYTMQQFQLDTFKNVKTFNGKIVAECDYEVEEISSEFYADYDYSIYDYVNFKTKTLDDEELEKRSCIDYYDICEYLGFYEEDKEKVGYAIHIKNLHIFDEPKELSEYHISYYNKELEMMREKHLEKAPQNMCRVFDTKGNYVFISIQPQHLCKILNKEKDVEVRKKVLKEMLK